MSEKTTPTRRIGTRAAVRQENSALAETEAAAGHLPEASPAKSVTSESPKVVPKEEPEPVETPPAPVTTATALSLVPAALPLATSNLNAAALQVTDSALQQVTDSALQQVTDSALQQVKDSALLQSLVPNPFTGRKRKANFSNEETETLVTYVVKHFSALYGSEALRTESTRRNQRRSQLWNQIQRHVNGLGYTPRSIDDLKHKWRDLRLEVKRKITHRRTASKAPPTPGVTPIIDTKLTPLEEQVASTIGHHCSLDGEQEGLYIEPGVPRQSIFFNCRGSPGAPMTELGTDKMGTALLMTLSSDLPPGSPRPEISLMSPLVSTSPAQLSFVLSEEGENKDEEMDVTPSGAAAVTIKPFPREVGTLVTAPTLLPGGQTIVAAAPQILTVKQEMLVRPVLVPARCESQNSIVSSPEGSLSNVTAPAEWNGDTATPSGDRGEMLKLKMEDEADSQDTGKNSPLPDSQDEWEGQSASPQPSDNAVEDSMPSTSSQDGDPSSGTDGAPNGDCSCEAGRDKDEVKAKMQRLLELEERWDRMYDQELGIWEEERSRQQQQRVQDRELQQQLLGVLTDIRDELRQLREERASARRSQAVTNGDPPAAAQETRSPKAAPRAPKTPKTSAKQPTPPTGRRRGRPRLIRPSPEPTRPIRPAPGPSHS